MNPEQNQFIKIIQNNQELFNRDYIIFSQLIQKTKSLITEIQVLKNIHLQADQRLIIKIKSNNFQNYQVKPSIFSLIDQQVCEIIMYTQQQRLDDKFSFSVYLVQIPNSQQQNNILDKEECQKMVKDIQPIQQITLQISHKSQEQIQKNFVKSQIVVANKNEIPFNNQNQFHSQFQQNTLSSDKTPPPIRNIFMQQIQEQQENDKQIFQQEIQDFSENDIEKKQFYGHDQDEAILVQKLTGGNEADYLFEDQKQEQLAFSLLKQQKTANFIQDQYQQEQQQNIPQQKTSLSYVDNNNNQDILYYHPDYHPSHKQNQFSSEKINSQTNLKSQNFQIQQNQQNYQHHSLNSSMHIENNKLLKPLNSSNIKYSTTQGENFRQQEQDNQDRDEYKIKCLNLQAKIEEDTRQIEQLSKTRQALQEALQNQNSVKTDTNEPQKPKKDIDAGHMIIVAIISLFLGILFSK